MVHQGVQTEEKYLETRKLSWRKNLKTQKPTESVLWAKNGCQWNKGSGVQESAHPKNGEPIVKFSGIL